jgi:uncharacterized membrane protein YphA (DoxX/SURF4 family)
MDTELAHASSTFTHALRSPSPTLAPSAANAPHPARRDDASVWSGARRVAFRLAFVYFALYIPSFPIAWWPRPLGEPLLVRLSSPVVPNGAQRWILAHVLHISPPWASGFAGAGDSPVGWANLFGFLAVAVVGSASWTLADRSRTHYTTLHHILRTAIRLTLGVVMLWYGVTKFAGVQFPGPSLGRLAQPVGELTPMALLWTTMGHSPGYARFAGGVEILGALLLFHRRTTTLGALILVGATANVLALNLAYDVGQKLFSAHLLVMAGLLVAPDVPRLAAPLGDQNRGRGRTSAGLPDSSARLARECLIAHVDGDLLRHQLACAGEHADERDPDLHRREEGRRVRDDVERDAGHGRRC